MRLKKGVATVLLALVAWVVPASQAAGAPPVPAPVWQLALTPLPTNFAPGSIGEDIEAPMFRLVATNVGAAPTTGTVTLSVHLPAGIASTTTPKGDDGNLNPPNPECKASTPQDIACTVPATVYPNRWVGAQIPVEVSSALIPGEVLEAKASVSGGGAAMVEEMTEVRIDPQTADFNFLSGSAGLSTLFTNADGTPTIQAGSHPDQLTVSLFLATEDIDGFSTTGAGHVRDIVTDLPQGVAINPQAMPVSCTEAELLAGEGENTQGCPLASQVGTVTIMTELIGPTPVISPLFNMIPSPGSPAVLGFNAANIGIYVHLAGGVRSDDDFGLSAKANDILARAFNPIMGVRAQIWGDPSSASRDQIRGQCRVANGPAFCPVDPQEIPFITMPSACSGPLTTEAHARSWEEAAEGINELTHHAQAPSADIQGNPVGVTGCSTLEFDPTLTLQPSTAAAESPVGVEVNLHVPQNNILLDKFGNPQNATSNVRDVTVHFPKGMALNPAAADGLQACTPAQIGMKTGVGEAPPHFSTDRPRCPNGSKIGTVEVRTPLLDHSLPGAVYVAQPYQNPFNSLLAAYVVIDSPQDGIVAKLAGRTEADLNTGQLTVTFAENPELPVEDFTVNLFGGPRAALRTPSTCGTYATTSVQRPWSGTPPVETTDSFKVSQGPNGGPCVSDEAQMPSTPGFEAGTQTPLGGSYSPFLGRLQRADGTQQLEEINMTLPAGLTGKLAGVQTCPEAAIAAAAQKSGASELASPSCPANSQIGEVKVGAGAGPTPYYTTGKIYLAGPYRGGPISAAVITPAVAGPFDLGTVVIRGITRIDPATAVLSVQSEEAPHILQGIPLELRDIQIALNRPQFTLNPTNCNEKAIAGEAISLLGAITPLSTRFQVGGCKGLDYEPKLAIRLFGKTGRGAHPRLRAILLTKPGEANTARASVALPRSEFLENAHIGTVCTRVQFAASNCPAKAIYGHATAITPLLDEPLEGPVYLRSSSHKLPDMVAALSGPPTRPIKVELAGRIDSVNGGIRSTFDLVPDQPVTKFVLDMFGGKKGLIVNSRNLCQVTYRAIAKFDGQNSKVHDFNPVMNNACKKGKSSKRAPR